LAQQMLPDLTQSRRRVGTAGKANAPLCQRTIIDRVIVAAAPMSLVKLIVAALDSKMQQASATTSGLRSGGVVRATRALNSGQRDVSELTSALRTADAEDGTPRKGANLSGRRKAAAGAYSANTGYAPPGSSLYRRRFSFLVDGGKHSFDEDAQMYSQSGAKKNQSEISQGDNCRLLSTPRLCSPRGFQNTMLPGNWTLEEQSVYDVFFATA